MHELRIETEGLTVGEVLELETVVGALDGVEAARFTPVLPGTPMTRSIPVVAMTTLYLIVRLGGGVANGVGKAAGEHIYKRLAETIVDRTWDAIKGRMDKGNEEVSVKLYGPDGLLIKEHRGKR